MNLRKVYFVDDDEFFLKLTSEILRREGFDVVSFLSASELLNNLESDANGCILADLNMPGMDGLALQSTLQQRINPLPVVFLTAAGDIPTSVQAMLKGAEDFLTKGAPRAHLMAAINRAFTRNEYEQSLRTRQSEIKNMLELLSDRELDVLAHVVQGRLNKQIADDLGIAERTVKLRRTAITTKLGMPSVAELTKLWLEAEFSIQSRPPAGTASAKSVHLL